MDYYSYEIPKNEAQKLKFILELNSSQRTKEQNQLVEKICENISLLEFIKSTKFYSNLCKRMNLHCMNPGDILFTNILDKNQIFIIIKGKINQCVKVYNTVKEEYQQIIIQSYKSGAGFWYDENLFQDIRGEVSLNSEEYSELISISKPLFEFYKKCLQKEDGNLKEKFILELPQFKGCNLITLRQFTNRLQMVKFSINTLIFRQGDYPDQIYLIYHGKCQILRSVKMKKYQYPHLEQLSELISNPQDNKNDQIIQDKLFELCTYKSGDFIGIEALLYDDHVKNSIIALEELDCFVITKQEFLTLSEDLLDSLKQYYKENLLGQESEQVIRKEYYLQRNWNIYKKNLIKEVKQTQLFRKNNFDHLLRKQIQYYFKKEIFIPDKQVHRKISAHVSLPPINQVNSKLFKTYDYKEIN